MTDRLVDDFIKRRNERAAAATSPLGEPAGTPGGKSEPPAPKVGEDPVADYIAERNRRAAEAPDPLKDRPQAR